MFLLRGQHWRIIVCAAFLGLTGCVQAPQPSSPTVENTSQIAAEVSPALGAKEPKPTAPSKDAKDDIWSRLRQADTHYYVLMRHGVAPGTGDPANFQLDDCSTQRNLSAEGRDQARRTGAAFRAQGVVVQQVLSSEWCRCLETAELLGLGPVQRLPALNSFFQDYTQEPERTQALREFMVKHQDNPGVTILVTHFVNISAISGSGVSSGEMVVMQVDEQNQPEVVDRIAEF